jgi:hypothetical protein
MAITSNNVPAAITHVDARTESEFTTRLTILMDSPLRPGITLEGWNPGKAQLG